MADKQAIVVLKAGDNVGTAVRDIQQGEAVVYKRGSVRALDDIPSGHKLALEDIPEHAAVRKYGERIGISTQYIPAGKHVHVHNVLSIRKAKA